MISRLNTGRSVYIGDSYDVRSEKFTGQNVFAKELPGELIRKTKFQIRSMKYDFSNSTSSKLSLLGIEGEFKLNLMCKAIVDASGSAAFAKHMNTTKNEMRCTFAFSSSTGESDININDERIHQYFKKDIKDSCGTHIVIGITLGASATAELFVETNDESCKIEMKEKLEANIGKANEWLNAGFNENAQYKDDELTNITNIRFNTYGAINVKKPNNVQEALEIINGLQETLDKQENDHVLEFHLMPLNILKEAIGQKGSEKIIQKVENNVIKHVEITYDEGEQLRLEMSSLKIFLSQNESFTKNDEIKKVNKFINAFDIAFSEFQQGIAEKLKEVKSGISKSNELDGICDVLKRNPDAGFDKAEEFLSSFQKIKDSINKINDIIKNDKIIFVRTPAEFDSLVISKSDILLFSSSFEESNDFSEIYWQFCNLMKNNTGRVAFVVINLDFTPNIKINNFVFPNDSLITRIHEGKLICKNVLKQQEQEETQRNDSSRVTKIYVSTVVIGVAVVVAFINQKSLLHKFV